MSFKKSLEDFQSALQKIKSKNIRLEKNASEKIYDFKEKKYDYYINLYKTSFNNLMETSLDLNSLVKIDKSNEQEILKINAMLNELKEFYKKNDLKNIEDTLKKIVELHSKLKLPEKDVIFNINIKNIPESVKFDFRADIKELEKCFSSGCYRSSVMLCGRLLEIALHRKYYEITNQDLLEKSPGIGLGKIIAKLVEKNIKFDPGLTQQIHLINQIRISSVHKQKDVFYPTKQQTQAMILYTMDILEKLFKNVRNFPPV